jgi:hypothetical protein
MAEVGCHRADPHRQRLLNRTGMHALVIQRRTVPAPPRAHALADFSRRSAFGEEVIVVVGAVAEQRNDS